LAAAADEEEEEKEEEEEETPGLPSLDFLDEDWRGAAGRGVRDGGREEQEGSGSSSSDEVGGHEFESFDGLLVSGKKQSLHLRDQRVGNTKGGAGGGGEEEEESLSSASRNAALEFGFGGLPANGVVRGAGGLGPGAKRAVSVGEQERRRSAEIRRGRVSGELPPRPDRSPVSELQGSGGGGEGGGPTK